MPASVEPKSPGARVSRAEAKRPPDARRPFGRRSYPVLVIGAFLVGLLISSRAWGSETTAAAFSSSSTAIADVDLAALREQINPPEGYRIGVRYGELGPRLLAASVIDYEAVAALYDQAGLPLTPGEVGVLRQGSNEEIVIDSKNSHFLLNFLWAVDLANRNSILTEGPMVKHSDGKIERFASTGGWSIAAKPITDLYASLDLIPLTQEQQSRVREVSSAVSTGRVVTTQPPSPTAITGWPCWDCWN